MTESPTAPAKSESASPTRPLRALGIAGWDALEPAILAALATESPILLIGPHGSAKTLLLARLAEALGLAFRHYNASILSAACSCSCVKTPAASASSPMRTLCPLPLHLATSDAETMVPERP